MKTPFFLFFLVIINFASAQQNVDAQKLIEQKPTEQQLIEQKITETKPIVQLGTIKSSTELSVEALLAQANELNLSADKQWLDLLHIRPNALGLKRSQVTGKDFFLAKDGYKNSKAELEATIRELLSEKEYADDKHPICFFPARKRWLKEKLQIAEERFPKPKCSLFNYYISHLNAESVSIVFSSYYPNNPGSVFGHTLFRINKKLMGFEKRNELLDHGIGYAANANIDNPVLYAAYGLFGGFKGVFTNVPYYYKVREYNDFESRSLWSYDLDLTPNEINYVAEHLWEVGASYFDYYFFTQNCGFHMLTVLEAAVPRLRVAENIPLWVIPSDSVKVLNQEPNLIKNISYRASVEEKFYKRWYLLSDIEKKYLLQWKRNKSFAGLESLSEDERIHVLDAVLDYFDYKNPNVQEQGFAVLQQERNQLLLARAKIQKITADLVIEADPINRPDLGHGSGRLGLTFGSVELPMTNKLRSYQELQLRFALHDLLDSPFGYPPGASIEFMKFRFRRFNNSDNNGNSEISGINSNSHSYGAMSQTATIQLEEFSLFKLTSLFPIDEFHRSPSWAFAVTSKRVYDQHCVGCYAGGIEGGIGGTWRSTAKQLDFFTFVNSSLLYSKQFIDSHLIWSAGPQLGLRYALGDFHFKLTSEANWSLEKAIDTKKLGSVVATQEFELRHNLATDWSWGFDIKNQDHNNRYELNLFRFF